MCGHDPSGRHVCVVAGCFVGRPFIVEGDERLASPASRRDWQAAGVDPVVGGLSAAARLRLAEYWTRVGLMEHASVAAFARFALHLLALGAPPDLILEAQQAMADETNHAQLAFALASAYARRQVGPGALDIEGVLEHLEVSGFVATLVREGCLGETIAAVEAHEALEQAVDPAVRRVLAVVVRDEQRHAELAWRTLGWLVATHRVSASVVREELALAIDEQGPARSALREHEDLSDHGLLSVTRRVEVRRDAVAGIVVPLARGLTPRPQIGGHDPPARC
jgi:hypothetical protein